VLINAQNKENLDAMRTFLRQSCTLNNFNTGDDSDPNQNYEKFINIFKSAINHFIPTREVHFNKHKHKKNPWITRGLINSIKFRDKLYAKLKSTPVSHALYDTLKNNLCVYNKILKKNIKLAKKSYFESCFSKYRNDMRNTWSTIKDVLNKQKETNTPPKEFYLEDTIISNPKDIANAFNNYFINIGPQLATNIVQPDNIAFSDYLITPTDHIFDFQRVTTTEVMKVIDNLKNKTSSGLDNISNKLLKHVKMEISEPLTLIINQSLSKGTFPVLLKISKVLPLHKKGDQNLIPNYRPISILPSISKIFERIMHNQLVEYFTNNNLFYENQYGFRKGHSTELAALELMNRNILCMDQNKIPINVFWTCLRPSTP
jgi:potassium voltage-gated channel Eag-related subfamily H protein 8